MSVVTRLGATLLGAAALIAVFADPAAAVFADPAAAVFADPAVAAASATVTQSGGVITFKAGAGQKNTVVVTGEWEGLYLIDDRVAVKAGKGCSAYPGDKTKALCGGATTVEQITIYAYDGNDSITNKSWVPMVAYGSTGDDTLIGGQLNDTLYAGKGNDRLWGSFGDDKLFGEAGTDMLDGGFGDDHLSAGAGNDKLYGKWDNDVLYAGTGNDFLDGGINGDRLYGQEGDDILTDMNHPYEISNELDLLNGGPNVDTCTAHPDDQYVGCERS